MKRTIDDSEEWIKDFMKFGEYCPKINADYEDKGVERDKACDVACNLLYKVVEHMMQLEKTKDSELLEFERAYVKNKSMESLLNSCGDRKCGSCIGSYLLLKRNIAENVEKSKKE